MFDNAQGGKKTSKALEKKALHAGMAKRKLDQARRQERNGRGGGAAA